MTESEEGFGVHAEVPSFSPKELEISVEPRRVIVSGKHETQEEKKIVVETKVACFHGRTQRSAGCYLPAPLGTEKGI
jgi:HSP20 family molecular chaperone IbpA